MVLGHQDHAGGQDLLGALPDQVSAAEHDLARAGPQHPEIVARRVDLPAPFGPTMQVTPPCGTAKSTPRSTSPPP